MVRHVTKSVLLIGFTVTICCVVYPLVVWVIAQTLFPDQANGSLVQGPGGTVVGSRLIAQPFTKDEYFQREAVHILATDAHSVEGRPPILSAARDAIARSYGAAIAHALTDGNPRAVVAGQPLPYFPKN